MVVTTGGPNKLPQSDSPAFYRRSRAAAGPARATTCYTHRKCGDVEHVQTRLRTVIPSINLQHSIQECLTRLPLTYLSDWAFACGVGPWRLHLWCSITAILTHGCWCRKRSYLCLPRGGPSMYIYIFIFIFKFIYIYMIKNIIIHKYIIMYIYICVIIHI